MTRLSERGKWEIVSAIESGTSFRSISNTLNCAVSSVQRWWDRFKGTGGVDAKSPTGRKPTLDAHGDRRSLDLILSDDCGSAETVALQLVKEGITDHKVHKTTALRHAKAKAQTEGRPIRCVRGRPRKALTTKTKQARLDFANVHKNFNWHHVMFTDRKKFSFKYPGVRIARHKWVRQGEQASATTVNHAQVLNLYLGITAFGVTRAHIVAGTSKVKTEYKNKKTGPAKNITAAEYHDVVKSTLLQDGKTLFGKHNISQWYYQQDNDPTHKSASHIINDFNSFNSARVSLLEKWPPNSPDLNPIENLWAWVQAEVDKKGYTTFDEFKEGVLWQFKHLPEGYLLKLVDSMNGRLKNVRERAGDKTKY